MTMKAIPIDVKMGDDELLDRLSNVVKVNITNCIQAQYEKDEKMTKADAIHTALCSVAASLAIVAQFVSQNEQHPDGKINTATMTYAAQLAVASIDINEEADTTRINSNPVRLLMALEAAEKRLGYSVEPHLAPGLVKAARTQGTKPEAIARDREINRIGHPLH